MDGCQVPICVLNEQITILIAPVVETQLRVLKKGGIGIGSEGGASAVVVVEY